MIQRTTRATEAAGAAGRATRRAWSATVAVSGRRFRELRQRTSGATRDAGMATAEYAIVMIAAVGFAGLLVVILRSAEIRETLTTLVRGALSA